MDGWPAAFALLGALFTTVYHEVTKSTKSTKVIRLGSFVFSVAFVAS